MKKFRKQDSEKYFEEKKPVRLVDTQEYMEMIRALLEDGQEVSMIVTGNSMRPFLKHGRDKICMKKTDRKLRKGDIVFYRRENGQYVMHRILKCGDQSYTLLGDGQIVPESGIRQEQIFARITKVQVRGKWIGSENFRWRFFEHIWIRFCGIRKLGLSFSSKVQNLKKSSKEIHNETVRAAGKWKDGTFQEIFDDWKWILHYSVRYRWTIFFYTFLGMVSTSLGLLSSIAGKYLIDIVTGYQMNKAGMIFGVMAGSFAVSLILNGGISRIMVKLNTNISNDIRADLFEQILDVIHAADVCHLQQLTDLFPTRIFFRGAILSGHMVILLCAASILHHTAGLHKVWDSLGLNILYRLCRFHALEAAETQAFSALNIPLATPCFAPYRSCSRALLWDG